MPLNNESRLAMLKVYYCLFCDSVMFLQYDKNIACRKCCNDMNKINISFTEFTNMIDVKERKDFLKKYFKK